MNTLDIAWLAGLLEGEGCFQFHKTPRITLTMTDHDVVERTSKMLGGIVYTRRKLAQYKQAYTTSAFSSRAAGIMMTIYCFMSARRQESIKKVLQLWCRVLRKPRPFRSYESRLKQSCKSKAKYAAMVQ